MTTQDKTSNPNKQARKAFRLSIALLVPVLLLLSVCLYFAIQAGVVQIFVVAGTVAVMGMMLGISALVCRRERFELGTALIIAAIAVPPVIVSSVLAEIGLSLGLLSVVATLAIGARLLSPERATQAVIISVVLGLLAGLIELFEPATQFAVPGLGNLVSIISVLLFVGLGALIARQFKYYSLRTKLLVAFFIVASTPLIILGFLVYAQPQEVLLQSAGSQTRITLIFAVLAAGVAAALAFFVARILAGPITRLTRVAVKISEGDVTAQAHVESDDEIGELATAFNRMTARWRGALEELEQRVAIRMRDLTLAAQVGQRISGVRELDSLLAESVELILSHFDLYYCAIYLTDPSGRGLVLRAGTGDVGAQLLKQGYRLRIGTGSLNGSAASEGQAVVVPDTNVDENYRVNPLLPDTRSEIVVPLQVRDQVVGVLDLQSNQAGALSDDSLPAFTALGSQLAVAIENTSLFEEIERSRAEVDVQARQLARTGWQDYFNAIDRSERLGYTYDLTTVTALESPIDNSNQHALKTAIVVAGHDVGTIHLQDESERAWSEEEVDLVQALAQQIAQQAESIRLVANAESYRARAEEVTSRLTHDTWAAHIGSSASQVNAYTYDLNEVKPLTSGTDTNGTSKSGLSQPLTIRGETIGELIAETDDVDEGAIQVLEAVAEQLSSHIENLRLTEQFSTRAAELETVAQVSAAASTILEADRLLQEVVNLTKDRFGLYHTHIYLLNEETNTLDLTAGAGDIGHQMVSEGRSIALDTQQSLVARAARSREGVIVNDVTQDKGFLPHPLLPETRAEMAVPMIVGNKLLGVLDVQSERVNRFSDEDVRVKTTLAAQIAVALQNATLYAQQTATVEHLEELSHLKSSFLANMSHELRTPLNSVLGFTDVMLEGLDGPLTENMEIDLKMISKNGQHLLHLINDVLDMAKIEAGRMNLTAEEFDIQEVLEEVIDLTSPLARAKALNIVLETDESMKLRLEADRIRVRQVMLNLVNNAIKFTDAGSVTIQAIRENDDIIVNIHDTGIGISPDQVAVVFEEFRQTDTSTTRRAQGTGLGLPISKKLVEMHGGKIRVESTGVPGEGSTFSVELPVVSQIVEDNADE